MIESITIKKVATFNDTGVQINELKKVNFFFGFNGSGKSTIANYIADLKKDSNNRDSVFKDCSNVGYDSSTHQILTFHEEFIEENFNRNPVLKGVFSLNQVNAAIDKQIEDETVLIQIYEQFSKKYIQIKENIDNDHNAKDLELLNYCWNQRSQFSTFSKITLAHTGSKPNHLNQIKRILENPLNTVLNLSELNSTYHQLYETDIHQVTINIGPKLYQSIRNIELKLEKLLQEVIVGNEDIDIADLIKKLDARNWVQTGLGFLEDSEGICPFCQQPTIDEKLIEKFNVYFDETYKNKIKKIESLKAIYSDVSAKFLADLDSIQNQFNPNNIISNLIFELKTLYDTNIERIEYKLNHTNEKKSLISILSKKENLSGIIKSIKSNNVIYSELDNKKSDLISEIWKFMAFNCQSKIQELQSRVEKYNRINLAANQLNNFYTNKINTSNQLIETLRSQTVNTKDSVDNINIILRNSGFEGFEIDEKTKVNNISQYYLKRSTNTDSNSVFRSLSEGEKNFISFLYFYQLCIGSDDLQNNGNKKKIIVIDDPVSSLDSQALFVVSTLIRNLVARKANSNKPDRMLFKDSNISQVFIFTHNIYFYKEVSLDRRLICTDWWHYHISKVNNVSNISGRYDQPKFDDYSLLWKALKETKSNIPQDKSSNILIANTMRRIIESYVNFLGFGSESWAALSSSDQTDPYYYIKTAFISSINDESHKVSAMDGIYYHKIINEQPSILFDVFTEIFKEIGREHYETMMDESI